VVAFQLQTRHCIFKRLPGADLFWKPSFCVAGPLLRRTNGYPLVLLLVAHFGRLHGSSHGAGRTDPICSRWGWQAPGAERLHMQPPPMHLSRIEQTRMLGARLSYSGPPECGCVFSMSESGRTLTRATPGDQTLIVGTSYNGCDSSKHFPSTASAAILISHSLVPRMVIIFHRQHQFPDLRYLAQRVPLRLSFPRDA
jgi:hypothetical protein